MAAEIFVYGEKTMEEMRKTGLIDAAYVKTYLQKRDRQLHKGSCGKVLVVAPKDTFGVDTLTRDRDALEKLYQEGYADGEKIETFLKQGR